MNNPPGKFISFEGGEGVGKSTQVALLRRRLAELGIPVMLTREPGGAPGAEEIRRLLLTGTPDKWDPMTEVLLFYAARVDHLNRTVLPALGRGTWVITDRYADSTIAYQGAGHGLDVAVVDEIHRIATGDFWPDLTIILDEDPALGLRRAMVRESTIDKEQREDRFEQMTVEFHQNLRQAFLNIAGQNPDRCRVVAASGTIAGVAGDIWQQVATAFSLD
ncbi:MAG: dTMP kinase [Alphaproteobacteria bacterium]|nr:dTMP kinase [Alphaproteobacteria bacterium]